MAVCWLIVSHGLVIIVAFATDVVAFISGRSLCLLRLIAAVVAPVVLLVLLVWLLLLRLFVAVSIVIVFVNVLLLSGN